MQSRTCPCSSLYEELAAARVLLPASETRHSSRTLSSCSFSTATELFRLSSSSALAFLYSCSSFLHQEAAEHEGQ